MSPSPYAGLLPLGPRLRFGGGLGLAPSHAHLPLWAGGGSVRGAGLLLAGSSRAPWGDTRNLDVALRGRSFIPDHIDYRIECYK